MKDHSIDMVLLPRTTGISTSDIKRRVRGFLLTPFEKYLLDVHHYLDSIGLTHWLTGSALLGSQRERRCLPGDREINFGAMAEDVKKALPELEKRFRVVHQWANCPVSPIFLHPNEQEVYGNLVDSGFSTFIGGYYRYNNKIVESMERNFYLWWLFDTFFPLRRIEFLGETFNAPNDPIQYFVNYYGNNWETPDPNFHWLHDAHNLEQLEDVC